MYVRLLLANFLCIAINAVESQGQEGRFIPNFKKNVRRCLAPDNTYGWCTHISRCPLPEFRRDRLRFMDYFCIIDRIYVGVCCPDHFLFATQSGTVFVGNPHFQQSSNSINGQVGQQNIDPGLQGQELKPVPDSNTIPLMPLPKPTSKPTPKPNVAPTPATETLPPRRGCGLNEKQEVRRITAGREADPKEWPWMAAIMRGVSIQFCGGSLITERHVLTAAHCTHKRKAGDIYVRLGEHDFTRTDETRTQNINVTDIQMHRDFDEITYENDISILRLARDALFNSYVWPVCLPESGPLYIAEKAQVVGWGTIEYGGPVSDKLLEVTVPIWKNEDCAELYAQPITETNICAGGQGGKDSCQGDSGGPLLVQLENRRWLVVGVVSWGIQCGGERPAIYTRVNKYLDWIITNAR